MRSQLGRRIALALAAGLFAATVLATPAEAHPDGPPQTLLISAAGASVTIHWGSAADDLSALGYSLGVFDAENTYVYDKNGALLSDESDVDDLTTLGADRAFTEYLLAALRVSSNGHPCVGQVGGTANLATAGVSLRFDCGAEVTEAEITSTLLVSIDSRYQLLATSDLGERFTYTDENTVHAWNFAPAPTSSSNESTWWWPTIAILALWLAGMTFIVVTRRGVRPNTAG